MGVRNKRLFPDDVTLSEVVADEKQHKANSLDSFRTVNMATKSVVQGYIFLTIGMVYYGLSLASSDRGGSLYRNFALMSAIKVPAVLFAVLGCDHFGRKKSTMISCLIGSILCTIIGLIPRSTILVRVTFGMFSKLISTSFYAMYTWSVEIYPTSIRGEGMRFLTIITSRIGAASAP